MEKRTLGKLIKKTREYRKITKIRLCCGLCTVTALTRYEQDIRTPDKFIAHALLERLGLNPFKYEFVTSEQEFMYSMRREQIERFLCTGEIEKMLDAVYDYEQQIKADDLLHIQYLLLKKAEIAGKRKEYLQGKLFLTEALKCTKCSNVCQEELRNIVLTDNEMKIIYLLAKFSYYNNEKNESYSKFQMLKKYIDKMGWDNEKAREYYPHILYRLAQQEEETCNWGNAWQYLHEAEFMLISNYKIDNLYEIVDLKKKIANKINKNESINLKDNFIAALKMIALSEHGKITEEGIQLWANTANRQL